MPYDFDNGPHPPRRGLALSMALQPTAEGGFYLTGAWAGEQAGEHQLGAFAHVPRTPHRPFGEARWRDIEYACSLITTGNTVFEKQCFRHLLRRP